MYTLYDYLPSGNGYKVRLVLQALALPFRYVECDITQGESRTPDFLERNPNGRIPLLALDDGRYLSESHAICWYLAEQHAPADGTAPLLPADPYARARVLEMLCFEQYNLEPNVAVRRYQRHSLGLTAAQLGADGERWLRDGNAALAVLEARLAGGDGQWLVGTTPTLADYALYAYTHVADEGDFVLEHYPRISAWLARVESLPSYVPITWQPPSSAG